ncbi:MAG: LON peptidase substrate-binding domain-containing protein [Aquincola tertiaricarbonis]|uniref:LON peptidase substrate-binding domain-containing protein n=1 Tax=Aquincola tertiaricarbonis TaxID=391953 RepID=UPI000614D279|nr:LON peptidase substrate-binding domain-containing protein [Aquincola tertiaricarbonis]
MSTELPLFPLQTVLFPGGRLNLKVFEARYLDMVGDCLRQQRPFGVVCLQAGGEMQRKDQDGNPAPVRFHDIGVQAHIDEVDAEQAGILHIRCSGRERFALQNPRRQPDGLWLADVALLPADELALPPDEMDDTVQSLREAIEAMRREGAEPFIPPYRFSDAGWVANRWCEILPISLAAKQKLMALDDPLARLKLVDEFLRDQGVIGG